jgi:hypothetical protein
MIRKVTPWLVPLLLAGLIATQWTDIMRYLKIKQMSAGRGHPELVPVEGTKAYPQDPAGGIPDGTGEFDAVRRGAPIER